MKINAIVLARLILVVSLLIGTISCKNLANNKQKEASNADGISVAFYNVENLFDTVDDPKTNDDEYTPQSSKKWTKDRYQQKLNHIGDVFEAMNADLPDLIGLAEIENRKVLEDLNNNESMQAIDYAIIHEDGYDQRGIDVALYYNPEVFSLQNSEFIRPVSFKGGEMGTRYILYAELTAGQETFHVFVNHWPSRGGDFEEKRLKRHAVATRLKQEIDAIIASDSDANILVMGDFNDYPTNKSIDKILAAGNTHQDELYNLMWTLEQEDKGSYCYKKDWGCLDQFIVSQNLINNDNGYTTSENHVVIFQQPWMMYTNKKGESYPSRTYSRDKYFGGYSDHLPIYLIIEYKK